MEALKQTCQRVIREAFLPQLTAAFAEALGEPPSERWGLELDRDDPDQQTLLFRYPQFLWLNHSNKGIFLRY